MTQPVFAEMFALAQCVPGPSSTQLAYGIGIIKKGVAGGMLSGFLFQFLPVLSHPSRPSPKKILRSTNFPFPYSWFFLGCTYL